MYAETEPTPNPLKGAQECETAQEQQTKNTTKKRSNKVPFRWCLIDNKANEKKKQTMQKTELSIAYIILFHKNEAQLINLINQLTFNDNQFVIHIDKPIYSKKLCDSIKRNCKNSKVVHIVDNPINVHWGGFSFVKAILVSLKVGLKLNSDYFSLISIQDYPVKTNQYITQFINSLNGKSIIEHKSYNVDNSKPNRLNRYYFYDYYLKDYNRPQIFNLFPRLLTKLSPVRKIKFNPFWGRVWWFLHRKHTQYIINEYEQNVDIIKFLKRSLLPDEFIFASLLANSKHQKELIHKRTTYADYNSAHPRFIESDEVNNLIDSPYIFARKFDFDSNAHRLVISKLSHLEKND